MIPNRNLVQMENIDKEKPETFDFLDVLRQKIRVNIINLLYDNVELSYTELLKMLDIDEGLLNFHLRKIKKFVQVTDQKTYMLSDYGKISYEILKDIDKKTKSYGLKSINSSVANGNKIQRLVRRRTIAFVFDILILMLSSGVIFEKNIGENLSDFFQLKFSITAIPQFSHEIILIYSNVVIASFIILTILEAYKGQTVGKYIMGLRVVKKNGGRITLMDSAVRNIGKIFFFPIDIILGVALHRKEGYIRFFSFYTETKVVKVSTP